MGLGPAGGSGDFLVVFSGSRAEGGRGGERERERETNFFRVRKRCYHGNVMNFGRYETLGSAPEEAADKVASGREVTAPQPR